MAKVRTNVVWSDDIASTAKEQLNSATNSLGMGQKKRPFWKRTVRKFIGRNSRSQKSALVSVADASEQINHNLVALKGELEALEQRTQDLVRGFELVSTAIERAHTDTDVLQDYVASVTEKVDYLAGGMAEHTESIVQLQRGIIGPSGDLRVFDHLNELENTAQRLMKNLDYLRDEAHIITSTASAASSRPAEVIEEEPVLGPALYSQLEDKFRGSIDDIRLRLSEYIPLVEKSPNSQLPILDIGCGRGEWLQLLSERGINCLGVDINEEFIKQNEQNGLNVILGDAIAYMNSLDPNSLRMVTAFHLIEHLPGPLFRNVLAASYHSLAPGGSILFETPNPGNVSVGSGSFYLDPTHIRPIPSEYAQFLAEAVGFQKVQILFSHPRAYMPSDAVAELPYDTRRVIEQLWNSINGPQDYALLAYK
jgi:2-polyprenyl-3-methyl-5-hydroxy-6-metoxy-1,4-benzoquinol methylase